MYSEEDICAVCLWLRRKFALQTRPIWIYFHNSLWTDQPCNLQVVAGTEIDEPLSKAARAAVIALGYEFEQADVCSFCPELCPAEFSNHALLAVENRIDRALRALAASKSTGEPVHCASRSNPVQE